MIKDIFTRIRHKVKRTPYCDPECVHYGVFGDAEGCEQRYGGWGGYPEPIQPGEHCLYPDERCVDPPTVIVSMIGLCAALEGVVIDRGPNDNTEFVETLTKSD